MHFKEFIFDLIKYIIMDELLQQTIIFAWCYRLNLL